MTLGDKCFFDMLARSWSDFDRGTVLNEIDVGLLLSSSNDLVRNG